MKTITLQRSDFAINQDDGSSFFDDVLYDLGIDAEDVDAVEIKVEDFEINPF